MINKIRFIGILFVTAGLVLSCSDDFLEKTNPNTLASDNFGFTEEEAFNLITAAYSPLNKQLLFGRWQQMTDNLRSDEAYAFGTGEGRGDLDEFGPLSASSVPPGLMWEALFTGVFRSNLALQLITERAAEQEGVEVQEEIGEAHFLRAYYYFWLVLNFNRVPLVEEPPFDRDEFYPAQAEPQEVWNFVIEEFTAAKERLPESWPDDQLGRATRGAATGCLARAYLFRYNLYGDQQDLQQAKANFDEVLQSGMYQLADDYFANFSLEDEFNSESIFEIPFVTYNGATNYNPNAQNAFQGEIRGQEFAPINTGGWQSVQPLERAFEEFTDLTPGGEIDPRRDVTFHYNKPDEMLYGIRFDTLYADNLDYVAWKKYQVSMYPEMYPTERVNNLWPPLNYRELRLGDMLLMLAEVENELGNTAQAVAYINQVRERAGVVPLNAGEFNQSSLRDQLVHERAVELCGEGKRWYDLLRWGRLEEIIKPLRPAFTSGIHEYLPIPANELSVNPNLVQNNGY